MFGNLAMEHRVEAQAIPALVDAVQVILAGQPDSNDLHEALQSFFRQRYVQPRKSVRFLGRVENVHSKTELLHVTSLSSFFSRLHSQNAFALNENMSEYLGSTVELPESKNLWGIDTSKRLAKEINELDDKTYGLFMSQVHALIPASAPCWWAAPVMDIGQQSNNLQNSAAIVLALGMGSCDPDDYLMVYRYPAKQAGLLYRPTTLETNAYPYHFPSSPDHPRPGGLSMPLQDGLVPCSEFIHHPLSADAAALSLQRPLRSLQSVVPVRDLKAQLKTLRQQHRQRLKEQHCPTQQGKDWIDRYQHFV